MNLFQSAADLLCFVLKYKMVAVAMLNFIFIRFYGTATCRTSNLARIWNFVQVRAIATKLWPINGIQNELLLFVQKSKMAVADILDFIFVWYFGIRACRTSNVIHLPNFVKICAIVNELWTIDEIQNGGRRNLEFIIFYPFAQMVYFQWRPSTFLQNLIHLRQSAAELLLFVQKFKMATAAILDFIFV